MSWFSLCWFVLPAFYYFVNLPATQSVLHSPRFFTVCTQLTTPGSQTSHNLHDLIHFFKKKSLPTESISCISTAVDCLCTVTFCLHPGPALLLPLAAVHFCRLVTMVSCAPPPPSLILPQVCFWGAAYQSHLSYLSLSSTLRSHRPRLISFCESCILCSSCCTVLCLLLQSLAPCVCCFLSGL